MSKKSRNPVQNVQIKKEEIIMNEVQVVPEARIIPEVENIQDLKSILGSDYDGYMEFKSREESRIVKKRAKEFANMLVTGTGKYAEAYGRLHGQLIAIWGKAVAEANNEFGIE